MKIDEELSPVHAAMLEQDGELPEPPAINLDTYSPKRFTDYNRCALFHAVPTKWHWVVWHPENLIVGDQVDIGAFTCLFAHHALVIERDVQIGSHCAIYTRNTEDGTEGPVRICAGARIGSHTVILPGVTIGTHAVVGACSYVKTDIPPNEVWCGVPARFKKRGDWE